MSVEISKRTRSQLVVSDHVLRVPLTRSPLKHARVTSRNLEFKEQTKDEEEMEVQDEEGEHKDDEILLSPKRNKRSSDARPEDVLSPMSYREPKRAKIDPLPSLTFSGMADSVENQDLIPQSKRKLARPFVRAATESACQKRTPQSAIMDGKTKTASIFLQRARSVPLPTDPFPQLDLRTLSPTRSPSKVTRQLKITPVPPPTEAAPTSPLTPPSSTDEDVPTIGSEERMDIDTASAMSNFTSMPSIDFNLPDPTNPTINIEFATPRHQTGHPLPTPFSPLTPLPPTSVIGRLSAVQSLFAQKKSNQLQHADEDTTSSLPAVHVAGPSTSSAAPSRLPRPSTSTSSIIPPLPVPVKRGRSASTGSSRTAHSNLVTNLSKGKKVMPPPGPRRVTRSVSMKGKKPEDLDEGGAPPEAIFHTGAGDTKGLETSSQTSTCKVPNLDRPSLRSLPDTAKFRQTSLASFMKAKPAPMSATDSSTSTATAVQRLPHTPSKIPLPVSPIKQRAGTSSSKKPTQGPSGIFSSSKHTSSLSTLSTALEKLAMPPPSRPNTSLGFNVTSEKDERTRAGPSTKDDSVVTGSLGTFSRPTASSLKRHATITGPTRVHVVGKMKDRSGALGRTATGIFGPGLANLSMKASRKTTLPSVMASPVKGGGGDPIDDNPIANMTSSLEEQHLAWERKSHVVTPPVPLCSITSEEKDKEASFVIEELSMSADKGKKREEWDSCRASSALHALSQSLSALPETPAKPIVVGTRTGLRSSSSMYFASGSGSGPKSAADMKNEGKVEEGVEGAAPRRSIPSKSETTASPKEEGSSGKKSALKVLKKCAIFVDVRTDDGDDAGSLFVDMLKGLGARILGRIGQSCTHIVYKNGSASTLTRYRLLNDPKPVVVGIAWVVECVEQRSRVDEAKFKVDLELVNVAGTNKRRRSMLPKHMSPLANGAGACSIPANFLSGGNDGKPQPNGGDSSPVQDTDTSFRSAKDEDDLPPLERARRRRSILPGGQTRLV